MKHIHTFSLFTLHFSLLFAALLANAAPSYWAAIETDAYTGDTSDGANAASYAMYYCTAESAASLFGGTSADAIGSYIASHFDDAKSKATTYDSVAFSDGEYQILDYVSAAFASSDYVAFALYGSDAYRVYGEGSATLTPNGELVFNESTAGDGTVGKWTAVSGSESGSTPEPTSGLLLLLGFAGLALKRKRA